MTVREDLSFAASYEVEQVGWATEHDLSFATDGVARGAPTVVISVTPRLGASWQGAFFGGRDSFSCVASTPDPTAVLVVAGGVGYLVDTEGPSSYVVVDPCPITQVVSAPNAGLLLCVGLTTLTALGPGKSVAWTTPRLVADGFAEVRLGADFVAVRGRAPTSDSEVDIVLDLRSGRLESHAADL